TSPIRRYADLIVHRALIRAFDLGEGGLTDREMAGLGATAEHITMTERRAMAAERDSNDRYVAAFMEDRIGQTFDARVTGVTRFGLFVRLADSGAEGLIPIRSLGADFFHHDEKRQALTGQRTRVSYGMGQALAVKLLEAAPLTGGLRFALADGTSEAPAAGKPRTGKPGKRPGKDRFRGKKR
ncbi:MAG TPA: S1 RNA-binding domain-containing protein, partial [Rhizomicrobium sp.]|nr:S1 RNA-binding domain-containing protein [Rhizomicrobium sp.]